MSTAILPTFNFKTKSAKRLADERAKYMAFMKGKRYVSYSRDIDEILEVTLDNGGFLYQVKDVASGAVRFHGTWIHPSKAL
jgi:hypothetical protein